MEYLIILFFSLLLLFLIFYPFKMTIYNSDHYLCFNFTNFITIKLNLLVLFDNNHNEDIKKQANLYKLFKKIKVENVKLFIKGINFDYNLNPTYYGTGYIVLAILDNYFKSRNIIFDYKIDYLGEKSLKFESVVKMSLLNVIKGMITSS